MRRTLLLAYSLSPGFAKLSGIDAFFGIGLVVLVIYAALLPKPITKSGSTTTIVRIVMFAFVAYGLLLGLALWLADLANIRAYLIGTLTFLMPLLAVAAAGPERSAALLQDVPAVAIVHAVLALAIYPTFSPDISLLKQTGEILLEGTFAFRLSSVSGSLAFSTLMTVAFAVSLQHYTSSERGSMKSRVAWSSALLFLCCGFLSLQRAAWIALALAWLIALLFAEPRRRGSIFLLLAAAIAPAAVALMFVDIPQDAVDIIFDRFATLAGAGEIGVVAERADQWLNALYNLRELPTGHGPGQIGQPVRETGPLTGGLPVYDGDYFRIISEYGAFGIAMVLLIAVGTLRSAFKSILLNGCQQMASHAILSVALLGITLQGIGTNVTELYFANTLFWALWMQSWQSSRIRPAETYSRLPRSTHVTGAPAE